MENRKTKYLRPSLGLLALFALWTVLVKTVDVKPLGLMGSDIGFAGINTLCHRLTGVHMWLYHATDWLGLVPVFVGFLFALLGLVQLIKRKSLLKVDADILLLGLYYLLVLFCYLAFEMLPVNFRPVLIEGRMEASYPSSTTLLVLGIMPTLNFQLRRRMKKEKLRKFLSLLSMAFSIAMVLGRLISGVHWLSDIVASLLLSAGLFCLYRSAVQRCCEE